MSRAEARPTQFFSLPACLPAGSLFPYFPICLLAYCLLAYCLLPIAYCLLPIAYCLFFIFHIDYFQSCDMIPLCVVGAGPFLRTIGKAVKLGRGRAAVTGDERCKMATVSVCSGDGKAQREAEALKSKRFRPLNPEARKPACNQPGYWPSRMRLE